MAFNTWRVGSMMEKEVQARLDTAMLRAVLHMKHHQTSRGFRGWEESLEASVVRAVRANRGVELMEEFCVERAFLKWVAIFDEVRWAIHKGVYPQAEFSAVGRKIKQVDGVYKDLQKQHSLVQALQGKVEALSLENAQLRESLREERTWREAAESGRNSPRHSPPHRNGSSASAPPRASSVSPTTSSFHRSPSWKPMDEEEKGRKARMLGHAKRWETKPTPKH